MTRARTDTDKKLRRIGALQRDANGAAQIGSIPVQPESVVDPVEENRRRTVDAVEDAIDDEQARKAGGETP